MPARAAQSDALGVASARCSPGYSSALRLDCATLDDPLGHDQPALSLRAWDKLAAVPDPEIPAVSLVELGIVRGLHERPGGVEVVLTPTYSGCPATELIADDVRAALREFGEVTVTLQRAPAWTTDWITPEGRAKLQAYGIVPPQCGAEQAIRVVPRLRCPRCAGGHTEQLSRFGSTPCKATWRCIECGEPFEYFKPL